MEFQFSISKALSRSVELFRKHAVFFVVLTLVNVAIGLISGARHVSGIVSFVLFVVSVVWSFVMIKASLAAVDGKNELLSFSSLRSFLPSGMQVLGYVAVSIAIFAIVVGGFILLIIPGIYFAFRLSLGSLAYVDKGYGIRAALQSSWDMSRGSAFWTIVLTVIFCGLLYLVGFLLFGIGILVTYPIAMILLASLYRALMAHNGIGAPQASTIVVQPAEILPAAESGVETSESAA